MLDMMAHDSETLSRTKNHPPRISETENESALPPLYPGCHHMSMNSIDRIEIGA